MKTKLITYHTDEYKKYADRLHKFSSDNKLFDTQEMFDDLWLKTTDFYVKNKWIFDNIQKGAGNCLWKPYLILKELEAAEEGDAVVYMDSQDLVLLDQIENFKLVLQNHLTTQGYCLVQGPHPSALFTKFDCFYMMNCMDQKYTNSRQLEAGFIGFVKRFDTVRFVKEWLAYCLNPIVLLDCKSTLGNEIEQFIDHRNEQAILTLLSLKYNLNASFDLFNIIDFNVGQTPPSHYNNTKVRLNNYLD